MCWLNRHENLRNQVKWLNSASHPSGALPPLWQLTCSEWFGISHLWTGSQDSLSHYNYSLTEETKPEINKEKMITSGTNSWSKHLGVRALWQEDPHKSKITEQIQGHRAGSRSARVQSETRSHKNKTKQTNKPTWEWKEVKETVQKVKETLGETAIINVFREITQKGGGGGAGLVPGVLAHGGWKQGEVQGHLVSGKPAWAT